MSTEIDEFWHREEWHLMYQKAKRLERLERENAELVTAFNDLNSGAVGLERGVEELREANISLRLQLSGANTVIRAYRESSRATPISAAIRNAAKASIKKMFHPRKEA